MLFQSCFVLCTTASVLPTVRNEKSLDSMVQKLNSRIEYSGLKSGQRCINSIHRTCNKRKEKYK